MVQTRWSAARFGRYVAFVVIGCAGLASGCGKKPTPPPEPVPESVAVQPPRPRPTVTLPARVPGLWEMTVTETASAEAPQTSQICLDAETDRRLGILGTDLSGDQCDKTVSRRGDTEWDILAACPVGETAGQDATTEYSGAITGDYTRDYTLKLRSQTRNSVVPQMNRVTNYVITARRTGNCAAGQAPGDVVNDGVQFNLFDMAGLGASSDANSEATP